MINNRELHKPTLAFLRQYSPLVGFLLCCLHRILSWKVMLLLMYTVLPVAHISPREAYITNVEQTMVTDTYT